MGLRTSGGNSLIPLLVSLGFLVETLILQSRFPKLPNLCKPHFSFQINSQFQMSYLICHSKFTSIFIVVFQFLIVLSLLKFCSWMHHIMLNVERNIAARAQTLSWKLPLLPRRNPELIPSCVSSQDTFSAYKTPVKEEQTFITINKNHLVSKIGEEKRTSQVPDILDSSFHASFSCLEEKYNLFLANFSFIFSLRTMLGITG